MKRNRAQDIQVNSNFGDLIREFIIDYKGAGLFEREKKVVDIDGGSITEGSVINDSTEPDISGISGESTGDTLITSNDDSTCYHFVGI